MQVIGEAEMAHYDDAILLCDGVKNEDNGGIESWFLGGWRTIQEVGD